MVDFNAEILKEGACRHPLFVYLIKFKVCHASYAVFMLIFC